ncbi:MAG TPA: universal stress protein [Acidimicrobiales bacterium]|nr:universal stress protein [Acidimicrobiales bacterium]
MMGRIVVGIDGSPAADEALRWAYREALLRGTSLDVVHAWLPPYAGDIAGMVPPDVEKMAEEGARLVSSALERVLGSATSASGPVEVGTTVVRGAAAETLLDASEGADVLVVGSRGRGGFRGLLLGSVSQQCASHAPCPVVIVRGGGGAQG